MPEEAYVLSGDVPEEVAAAVIDYASRRGYSVYRAGQEVDTSAMEPVNPQRGTADPPPSPRWSAGKLDIMLLTDDLLIRELSLRSPEQRQEILKLLKRERIETAGDLTRTSFETFMKPHRGFMAGNWYIRSFVLEFMIKNGISFSDLNPALTFRTHVNDATVLSVRATNHLLRYGIKWVELLAYVYEYELLDIRNFGARCRDEVKIALAECGLTLLPQTD